MGLQGVTDPAKYARQAFDQECAIAASTGRGRNDQLNRSSFAVGQLVGSGHIDRSEAEHALFAAAQVSGYVAKDGAAVARSTIASGLDKGIREPREGLKGALRASAAVVPLKAKPKLDGVPLPSWTEPDADGKPKFIATSNWEPGLFPDDLRRHVYRRDGQPVRVKVKKASGTPAWADWYKVQRPDGVAGWQAKKPEGYIPCPYIGPAGTLSPFDPKHRGETLFWTEGEKDADAIVQAGGLAFTFGGTSDAPDCGGLVHGFKVIIVADNDAPGEKCIPRKVDVVRRAEIEPKAIRFTDMHDGADAADFLEAGNTLDDMLSRAEPIGTEHQEKATSGAITEAGGPTDPVSTLVERFNSRYMVVNEVGKAIILQPGYDPVLRRRRHDRMAVRDLQTLYMNELIEVGKDDKGRSVNKPVADVWLKHPARRQYINGITFDPTAAQQDGVLNLWEGYAVPAARGDWSLMLAHIRDVICDRDPIRFDYIMGWMARMLQRPAEQGEVAVVMRGGEGTGKGSLAKALMRITGHHGLAIANAKHLVGNFNSHLRDVVYLFADEAFFAGDRSHVGTLKSLITEPHLPIEGKFQNVVLAPNFLHLMMASNEDWVVPAALDARRFFVLEVSDAVKGDHNYFAAIWRQMEAGGYSAMLHDLLAHDLKTFNVRAVPTTAGLQHQRKLSLPTTEAWWLDCLERGYIFKSRIGLHDDFGQWPDVVATELLFTSYLDFAKARGERRPLIREHLGRFLTSLGAQSIRPRKGLIGEEMRDVRSDFGSTSRRAVAIEKERPPSYAVGALDVARQGFVKATKINMTWEDESTPDAGAAEPRSGLSGSGQGTHF